MNIKEAVTHALKARWLVHREGLVYLCELGADCARW